MRVFICDDDINVINDLKLMVGEIMEERGEQWEIHSFLSAEEMERYSAETMPGDVILMDIRLEAEDGIQAAGEIQRKYPATQVIFITGYINMAEDIFEAEPCAFLVKPVNRGKLENAFIRAEKCKEERREYITFEYQRTVTKICVNDIDYVESQKRELYIHGNDGIQKVYMKLDEFMDISSKRFLRTHKSYAVNMDKIKYLSSVNVTLKEGQTIPVSRTKYKEAKECFLKYCSKEFMFWDERGQ